MILQLQEQWARCTCYRDLRSCASQLTAALVPPFFFLSKFQAVSRSADTPVQRSSCSERTFVEQSWRADFCPKNRSSRDRSWQGSRRQYKMRQLVEGSGLALIEAQRSKCTRTGRLDSNIRRNEDIGLYHVFNTHAHSSRKIDRNIRTRARASSNRRRATHNRNCQRCILHRSLQIWERLGAFTFLTPPGLQPGLRLGLGFQETCMSCFRPRLPSAPSRKRARSLSSAAACAPRFH